MSASRRPIAARSPAAPDSRRRGRSRRSSTWRRAPAGPLVAAPHIALEGGLVLARLGAARPAERGTRLLAQEPVERLFCASSAAPMRSTFSPVTRPRRSGSRSAPSRSSLASLNSSKACMKSSKASPTSSAPTSPRAGAVVLSVICLLFDVCLESSCAAARIVRGQIVAPAGRRRSLLTAATRAAGSIGKVTTDISQRSASRMRRMPVAASFLARTVRKPIDRPSRPPAFSSASTSRPGRRRSRAAPRHRGRARPRGSPSRRRSARPDCAGTACGCRARRFVASDFENAPGSTASRPRSTAPNRLA